jgi:hypothetical protein
MGVPLFDISMTRFYAIAHIRVTIGLGKTLGEWDFCDTSSGDGPLVLLPLAERPTIALRRAKG